MKDIELIVGWREWIHLPELGTRFVKAKVDTGARTSALHAEDVEYFTRRGKSMVRFAIQPKQRSTRPRIQAEAKVAEMRSIRSSNGVAELRPVIETEIDIGGHLWPIELTLTSRDVMGFRMLLGRQAIRGQALVDPGRSFLTRKVKKKAPARRR